MTEIGSVRRLGVLGVCCTSVLLVGIDMTAVNVALPALSRDFGISPAELSWVVNAYTLALATLLMFSASMADRIGRKSVFLVGLIIFAGGSALCAFAPSLGWMIAFRVVQAVGGSMLNPVAMAILSSAFPEPEARARAIGVWGGMAGLSLAVGPILGGAFVDSNLGWRWIFAINIPIGAIAAALASVVVVEAKALKSRRQDPGGQLLAIALLVGMTYGIVEGGRSGWAAPEVIVSFSVSVAGLVGIFMYEPRRVDPMIELRFFRSAPFSGANVIAVASFAALGSFLFLSSLYLQQARCFDALHTGLLMTPVAIVSIIYGPMNGRILARWGVRPCLLVAGVSCVTAGMMLARTSTATSIGWLMTAYALFGLGNAAASAPVSCLAITGMPSDLAGLASGVSSTARQVGATLGVAIAGAALSATNMADREALAEAAHAGWRLLAVYGALIAILGILITTKWAVGTAIMANDKTDSAARPATNGHYQINLIEEKDSTYGNSTTYCRADRKHPPDSNLC